MGKSEMIHKRNTEGLDRYRKERAKACEERVEASIRDLIKNHDSVNFNSVSEKAGVSKKYLYDNHFERIDELRKKQSGVKPKAVKHIMTDKNKDALLMAKNKRIKALEEENARLKEMLKQQYSEMYEEI
ncbi:DUF6262 family protein [Acetobacterium carbinolicum]|uniref:DUF6262 family protein n=1 Tax=Acetobacterium carbinolicum TaxID=52690 RepID=UPI0039C94B37